MKMFQNFLYDNIFTKLKYVKYTNDFIFEALASKKLVHKIKFDVTKFIN